MAKSWLVGTAITLGMIAAPTVAAAQDSTYRVFGGISSPEDVSFSYAGSDVDIEGDSGWVVGGALGVRSGDWTFEGELSYRTADISDVKVNGVSTGVTGDVSSTSLMANAWYNFPRSGSFGFYAGGGVGLSSAEVSALGYESDGTEFAWQLGIGANMQSDSGFTYGVGYRYFNIAADEDIASHDFVVEFGRRF